MKLQLTTHSLSGRRADHAEYILLPSLEKTFGEKLSAGMPCP
jgi:hypothetical protein